MISLDTNVIVRYIVQDDKVQSNKATEIIEGELSQERRGFISSIVLCEVIWVLARAYKQPKSKLLEVIRIIFETDVFELKHRSEVWRAYVAYAKGKADFSDYLIDEIGRSAGADKTVTFDEACSDHEHFSIL